MLAKYETVKVCTSRGYDGALQKSELGAKTHVRGTSKTSVVLVGEDDRPVAGEAEAVTLPMEVIFDPGATAPVVGLQRWKEMVEESLTLDERKPRTGFSRRGFLYGG